MSSLYEFNNTQSKTQPSLKISVSCGNWGWCWKMVTSRCIGGEVEWSGWWEPWSVSHEALVALSRVTLHVLMT